MNQHDYEYAIREYGVFILLVLYPWDPVLYNIPGGVPHSCDGVARLERSVGRNTLRCNCIYGARSTRRGYLGNRPSLRSSSAVTHNDRVSLIRCF